jgi:hypothetical protein
VVKAIAGCDHELVGKDRQVFDNQERADPVRSSRKSAPGGSSVARSLIAMPSTGIRVAITRAHQPRSVAVQRRRVAATPCVIRRRVRMFQSG